MTAQSLLLFPFYRKLPPVPSQRAWRLKKMSKRSIKINKKLTFARTLNTQLWPTSSVGTRSRCAQRHWMVSSPTNTLAHKNKIVGPLRMIEASLSSVHPPAGSSGRRIAGGCTLEQRWRSRRQKSASPHSTVKWPVFMNAICLFQTVHCSVNRTRGDLHRSCGLQHLER